MADPPIALQLLGPLAVRVGGEAVELPRSRKTRALLAYLAVTQTGQSRQKLCEMFWDTPNDPRAALRWSLSKLRTILSGAGQVPLQVKGDFVQWTGDGVACDLTELRKLARSSSAPDLERAWNLAQGELLADCECPNLPDYSAWLRGQRIELSAARAAIARSMASDHRQSASDRRMWLERLHRDSPDEIVTPREDEVRPAAGEPDLPGQDIRFTRTKGGVSLAWASVGPEDGVPLVKAANWLSHLERDWQAPIWSPLFRELARDYRFLRYDERGCGLSDREVADISQTSFVSDLAHVVDAASVDRFALLGISQGAAVSIEYAVLHPDRVSHLVLFGGYPVGWRHVATPEETREREAVIVLTESGWGRDNPSYRHMFSQTFMPTASAEELTWFDAFQRETTSPANAARFLEAFSRIDVRDRLGQIRCPTLVVHSRGDQRIPLETGREMAARIPGARFAVIDSENHLLLGREPASAQFVSLVREFLRS